MLQPSTSSFVTKLFDGVRLWWIKSILSLRIFRMYFLIPFFHLILVLCRTRSWGLCLHQWVSDMQSHPNGKFPGLWRQQLPSVRSKHNREVYLSHTASTNIFFNHVSHSADNSENKILDIYLALTLPNKYFCRAEPRPISPYVTFVQNNHTTQRAL